nr:MAG TPA: hypothetical protein [Caudoviricetes sp.]
MLLNGVQQCYLRAEQRVNNQAFTRMQQGTKRRTNNAKCIKKPMKASVYKAFMGSLFLNCY